MALIPTNTSLTTPTNYFEGVGFFGFELSGEKIVCFMGDLTQKDEQNVEISCPNFHLILCGNLEASSTEIKVNAASIIALNNVMKAEKISLISEKNLYTLACNITAHTLIADCSKGVVDLRKTVSARILTIKENFKKVMAEQNGELFKVTLMSVLELIQAPSLQPILLETHLSEIEAPQKENTDLSHFN